MNFEVTMESSLKSKVKTVASETKTDNEAGGTGSDPSECEKNLDPQQIDVIERQDLEEENRHIKQCSGMIVDIAATASALIARNLADANASLTPSSETASNLTDNQLEDDLPSCSFHIISSDGGQTSNVTTKRCIAHNIKNKSSKDENETVTEDLDNLIDRSEINTELVKCSSPDCNKNTSDSNPGIKLQKPLDYVDIDFHKCCCTDLVSIEVGICSSVHDNDYCKLKTRGSRDSDVTCKLWRKRKSNLPTSTEISPTKKFCSDGFSRPSNGDDSSLLGSRTIHEPSELKEWVEMFNNWTNLEKIQAINVLITHSSIDQVRHMMNAIEPLLRRDFIYLLPKEVALMILRYLQPQDLLMAAQTCRYWNMLADNCFLWRKQCISIGITSVCNSSKCMSLYANKWKSEYMRQMRIESNWVTSPVNNPIVMRGHYDHVITCLEFYGDKILSGSDDNTLKIWSASTGECLSTLVGHIGGVWCCEMRDNLVVSGSTDRTLRVWMADTGECINVLTGHTTTVRCMHLYKDKVVSGARDTTLRVWSIPEGRCLRVLSGHRAAVRCVQYNGKLVASGAYDNCIKIWDGETGDCLHTLNGHSNRVYTLQFDGAHLVSGSYDTSVCVWDLETGQLKHTLHGHEGLITSMELHSNIIITGSGDSTAKVWDINTGQCLYTLSGPNKHTWAVNCLQTTRRFVITSSGDGTVKLWDLHTGEFIRNLVSLASGEVDGSGGVAWRIRASPTKLVCAVGSRNGVEETKLLIFDFDLPKNCC